MAKLVRDKIPEIILENMQDVHYEIAVPYSFHLSVKLQEETTELYNALCRSDQPPYDDVYEELADVLEVIDAIIKEWGLSKRLIRKTKRQKRKEIGGFDKKYLLLED